MMPTNVKYYYHSLFLTLIYIQFFCCSIQFQACFPGFHLRNVEKCCNSTAAEVVVQLSILILFSIFRENF